MMGQAGRPSFHYPALPCPTLLYSVLSCFVCLLEFNVEEKTMYRLGFESI